MQNQERGASHIALPKAAKALTLSLMLATATHHKPQFLAAFSPSTPAANSAFRHKSSCAAARGPFGTVHRLEEGAPQEKSCLDSKPSVSEKKDSSTSLRNDRFSFSRKDSSAKIHSKVHLDRFYQFRSRPISAPQIQNVYLLSDLHCDYSANRDWLSRLCGCGNEISINGGESYGLDPHSMILIAGDVSHDLDILRWTFKTLKSKFGEVAFVPGNHELWLHRRTAKSGLNATGIENSNEGDGCVNSIEKLEKIFQICVEEDIRIGPVRVGSFQKNSSSSNGLWILPLLSWHHASFDTEPPIDPGCWGGIPSARKVVADYRRTVWPSPLSSLDDSVAKFMDVLNDVILDLDPTDLWGTAPGTLTSSGIPADTSINNPSTNIPILTFSHFLPRLELLPEKRYLTLPTLHTCVGSMFLEERLRTFRPCPKIKSSNNLHLHAFGHTHLAWDATIDGVRYVHVPLAYPREWQQRRKSLEIGSMRGEESINRLPVRIWEDPTTPNNPCDSAWRGVFRHELYHKNNSLPQLKQKHQNAIVNHLSGFPKDWLGGWWSKYYAHAPRQPHKNKELAPWVAKRFRQLPGGIIEDFDHIDVEKKLHGK